MRIFGKIEGDDPLSSPVADARCFYYSALAEKRVGEGAKARWDTLRKASETRNFYVNDGTSRVLVEPARAEFDVTTTLEAKLDPASGLSCKVDPSLGLPAPTQKELRGLLRWDWKQPRPAALAATEEPEEQERPRRWWMPESIEFEGLGELSLGEEAKAFRIMETCLLEGHEYSLVGTCQSSSVPEAPDLFVIRHDVAQKTFVISSKRGEQMAASLRKQGLTTLALGAATLAFGILLIVTRHQWGKG